MGGEGEIRGEGEVGVKGRWGGRGGEGERGILLQQLFYRGDRVDNGCSLCDEWKGVVLFEVILNSQAEAPPRLFCHSAHEIRSSLAENTWNPPRVVDCVFVRSTQEVAARPYD